MSDVFRPFQRVTVRQAPTSEGGIDASRWSGWAGEIVTAYLEPWKRTHPYLVYEVRLQTPSGRVFFQPITENWLDAATEETIAAD